MRGNGSLTVTVEWYIILEGLNNLLSYTREQHCKVPSQLLSDYVGVVGINGDIMAQSIFRLKEL